MTRRADPRYLRGWNAAVRAAAAVCREVDGAAEGQGLQMRPATRTAGPLRNPHAHRDASLRLGAQRCLTGIVDLHR